MKKPIKRKVQKSTQPEFHSELHYYSELELSKTSNENLEKILDSRSQFLEDGNDNGNNDGDYDGDYDNNDDAGRDLKHFANKAMKNIWG